MFHNWPAFVYEADPTDRHRTPETLGMDNWLIDDAPPGITCACGSPAVRWLSTWATLKEKLAPGEIWTAYAYACIPCIYRCYVDNES
jgi:hypothetical protein